ncbi:39S ribosomal protein L28, mitochondrial [Trichoplax sp. H2]|nr:39S ribosomal protein L28, mitochondrial [Trichoplax sp. H2]|eukprot:RDD38327.1 39S ribosomal protein L28, mitochondrial [Trichoplax sp. H2]
MVRAILLSILRAPYYPPASQKGLWGGEGVVSGYYTTKRRKHKIKRKWHPNVQTMKLFSDILDQTLRVPTTMSALKQIERAGSLDNYILRTPDKQLNSEFAFDLRKKILSRVIYLKKRDVRKYQKAMDNLQRKRDAYQFNLTLAIEEEPTKAFKEQKLQIREIKNEMNEIKKNIGICEWEILDAKRRSVTEKEKYLRKKAQKFWMEKARKKQLKQAAHARAVARAQESLEDEDEESAEPERKGVWNWIKSIFSRK